MNNILNKLANYAKPESAELCSATLLANFEKNKIVKLLHYSQIINLRTPQQIIKSCRDTSKYNPIPQIIPIYVENERGYNE